MRRLLALACALLTALQPLSIHAHAIGEALRNADRPLPHVLPIADRPDMLPLPYLPQAWSARRDALMPAAPEAVLAQLAPEPQPETEPAQSPTLDRQKALAASTTTLTAAPSPSTFGATRTLTATVVSTATVTGTVNFTEGATALCSAVALAGASATSKTATCVVAATATAGAHTYTAAYGGNTTAAASSGTLAHTINKATPTVALVSDLASPTTAQSFVLTATMSLNTATGSVDFKEGATVRCAAVALTGTTTKTATCTIPATTLGAHTYTSNYLGDSNHNTATVNRAVTVVALTASTTAIAVAPSPSTYGATRTLTATVTPSATAGTVNFTESGTTLTGCGAVALTGTTTKTATCVVAATAAIAGAHTYAAAYGGNATYATSSGTVAHTVNKATAAVATAATPAGPTVGQSVLLTATITPNTATGSVDFKEGATVRCAAVAITGTTTKTATCTISAGNATQGAHTYTTNYLGDANHNTAAVNTAVTVAALTASTTAISVSPSPSTYGATRTLTATVTPSATTGAINFTESGTTLTGCGAVVLTGTTTKTATCVVAATAASAGAHTYAAAYGGDSAYATSSGSVAHTVNRATATGTVVSTPASIQSGQAFTLTATINPNTATGSVAFTDGATALAGCAAVVLTGTTTKTAVCSVSAASSTTGTHTYNINYAGDTNHSTAVASLITNIVAAPGASSTVLTANPNPGAVGQSVLLTATVTPNTATGSINFTESGATLPGCGAVALTGATTKSANCTVIGTSITLGSHAYAAAYPGDGSLAASNGSLSLTVGKRNTTLTTVVNPAAPVSNQAFTIEATVADIAATGSITVSEGGTTICSALPLSASAPKTATCNMPGSTAASHSYTVSYSGDSSVNSASTTATVGVTAAPDDDDDGILPIIIAALRPKCDSMTATPSSVTAGASFALSVNCTFKGNLVKDYVWAGSGVPNPTLTTVSNYTVSAAPTTPGTYVYSVLANNGNVPGSLQSVTVTVIANVPPAVSIARPFAGEHVGYRSAPITGGVNANDTDPGIASIQITIDGANWGTPCTFAPPEPNTPKTCTQPIRTDLPAGAHTFGALATDALGTPNTAAVTYFIDPASASCTLTANAPTVPTGGNAVLIATCTAFDGIVGTTIGLQGATIAWSTTPACASSTTTTDGAGVATCTTASLSAASTFSFTATKSNYATAGASVSVAIASANPPPKILSISPSTPSFLLNTAGVFTVQASDDTALTATSLQFSSTNTLPGASILCTGGTTESCTVSWTPTSAGVYTLGLQLTDSQGAVTTATTVVAVSELPSNGVPDLPSQPPTAAVGTTAGQFAVSESGAATYSIPIQVPPGVAGLQPNLAITYNSQGGDGPLGVGWNLSGLSTITRCPKTIAADGIREPINYDAITDPTAANANDAFCLDGQRLLPVTGGLSSAPCVWPLDSSTTPNSSCRVWEFRTELENYSRILGIGDNAIGLNPGSGPTRFRVYTKSGQILEYGSRWWAMSRPRPKTVALAQLMTNGSFETPDMSDIDPNDGNGYVNPNVSEQCVVPCWYDLNLIADGWQFAGDSGIQRTGSAFNSTAPVGYQNAIVRNLGSVRKTVSLVAGTYTLSFLAAGRPGSPGGAQRMRVKVGGVEIMPSLLLTSSLYSSYSAEFTVTAGNHVIAFEGVNAGDTSAFLDDVQLVVTSVPTETTEDATVLKVWPLDRVEDRSGNYLHIDYGGTHSPLPGQDDGTVIPSFGTAQPVLNILGRVAAGARPEVELYPRRITYGMRVGETVAANVEIARVILNYGNRPATDTQRGFDTGAGQMLMSKRLLSIVTTVGGTDDTSSKADRDAFHLSERTYQGVDPCEITGYSGASCGTVTRRYNLIYTQSPSSSRSRLMSVTECGRDGTCLPQTTFAWQEETNVSLSGAGSGLQNSSVAADGNADWNFLLRQGRVADVVGDGKSRIVRRTGSSGQALQVCTHNGTKFTCETWALPLGREIPDAGSANTWNLADFTGDGIADLVVTIQKPNNVYLAYACPLPGNALTGIASCVDLPGASAVTAGTSATPNRYYAKTADFNGDGRIDVAFYRGNGYFEFCLATGTAAAPTWSCKPPTGIQGLGIAFANVSSELNHLMVADFNGDGRADIAYRVANACIGNTPPGAQCLTEPTENDSYWAVCFSAGPDSALILDCATRYGVGISGAVKAIAGKVSKLATFDFNGDGLADMGALVPGQGWRICLATGDGEFKRGSDGECPVWGGPLEGANLTAAGDFNGDGRTDLAYFDTAQGNWRICLSTGSSFECSNIVGPASPAVDGGRLNGQVEAFAGDYNGDGKTDIAVNGDQDVVGYAGQLSYGFTRSILPGFTSGMPDILSTITTGLGAQTKINYLPLTNSEVYTKNPPDITTLNPANEIDIQSPMYVVRSTCATTGGGNADWYKSEHYYGGLRADKWGRGLYGFFSRSITDNLKSDANCTSTDSSAAQTTGVINSHVWPNVGRPLSVAKTVANPFVSPSAPNAVILVSTASSTYGARCRDAASNIVPCPSSSTPGYRWEGLQTKSVQSGSDLPPAANQASAALPTTTVFTGIDANSGAVTLDAFYDAFGNPLKVTTRTVTGGETWQQDVINTYHLAVTNQWLLGKLDTATTTSAVSGYTTNGATSVTRKSSFTYQGIAGGSCTGAAPGQLCTETVEPDRAVAGTHSLYQRSAYTYDAFGNRLSSTANFYNDDAGTGGLQTRSSATTYQYGKYPHVNTRAYTGNATLNLSDTREYTDARCRMPTKVTDANGNYAETQYDGFCRKVSESARTNTGKLVKWSTFTLANSTNSTQQPSAAALGFPLTGGESYAQITTTSDGGQSAAFYDNLQRTVRAQTRTFSGTFAEASTVYDALGRKSSVTQPVSSGAGTGTATTNYFYDAMNRVTQEKLPDTNTVDTVYNGLTTTVTRSNTTGSAGNAVARSSSKTANAKGMVATVTTSPIATSINYTYDAIGNLTKVVSPGANSGTVTKTMAYDLRGRQTQLVDPDAGTYNYTYNGAGEQRTQTDSRLPTNYVTTANYDPFGRKTTRTETQAAGGDATTTWGYDCANGKGLLCSVSYSGASTAGPTNATSKTTTYDQYSRPVATSTVIAGQTFVSQVAYDGRGRPLYSVYPQATLAAAQLALKQSYNSYGFATQTEHATTGFVYSTINSRNNDGQVNGTTMGGGLLTHTNGYSGDGLGRIASISIAGGTALTQSFSFESVGNLKSRSLTGGGRTEVENFTYDALDRLLSSGAGVGNVTALPDTGSFGYDSAGNLNSKVGLLMGHASSTNSLCTIGVNTACAVRETNLATAAASAVVYDGNGNIQRYLRPLNAAIPGADGATLTLSGYTAFNLPTSVTKSLAGTATASAEFFYDAGYQRVRQVKRSGAVQTGPLVDDILYVVPGGFELHRNAAGQITSSIATVSGPDGVVATVSTQFDPNTGLPVTQASVTNLSGTTTVTKLLLKDHLGSMVAEFTVTAANAGTLVVHGFGPWGNARNGLNGDQRGFTGHEHLAELGIIHMNGRLYDAVLGRFLQADPIIQAPHNAQSHNRYSYVLNNPLSFTDPSGFSAWTQWRSTVFAIVAAVTMQYYLMPYLLGASSFAALSTGGKFLAVVASGFASGGIAGGNIQSALQGAFVAGLTFGLATEFGLHEGAKFLDGKHLGQMALHSAMGCAQSAAAGGSCKSGAVSGGVSAFASPLLPGDGKSFSAGRLIGNAIIGAVAARLSGGKAENGALTAAFSYLFNEAAVEKGTGSTSEFVRRGQTQYPVTYDYENAKIIIMDPNDGEFAEAYARKGTPGQLLIISHGHERMAGGMFPPQMDAFIRASGMWKAGMDVVHDACNVGRLDAGFARAMAESLGVNYTAPTRYSWSAWGIWGTTNGGNIPDFTDPGRMRTFSPLNPRQRN